MIDIHDIAEELMRQIENDPRSEDYIIHDRISSAPECVIFDVMLVNDDAVTVNARFRVTSTTIDVGRMVDILRSDTDSYDVYTFHLSDPQCFDKAIGCI